MSDGVVRIFDVSNGVVVPTEHCYALADLRNIMDNYPDNYMSIYLYVFYMTCPDPDRNPFFNVEEHLKEEYILKQINADFSPEDDYIPEALSLCHKLYETPTLRAYIGIKMMLDNMADYMAVNKISSGRDGNFTNLLAAAEKFGKIRENYKGTLKDLKDEQRGKTRGGAGLAYDQQL